MACSRKPSARSINREKAGVVCSAVVAGLSAVQLLARVQDLLVFLSARPAASRPKCGVAGCYYWRIPAPWSQLRTADGLQGLQDPATVASIFERALCCTSQTALS